MDSTISSLNNLPMLYKFGIFGAGFIGVFAWEHIARKKKSDKKPSVMIAWSADNAKKLFTWIGGKFAWLSSFYNLIDMKDLKETANALIVPTWNLVTSPFWSLHAYYKTTRANQHPWVVVFGSMTLGFAVFLGLHYFGIPAFLISFFGHIHSFTSRTLFGGSTALVLVTPQ